MENLESQKGVVSVEVARINMSKRVAPTEMWKKYRESKYVFKPTGEYEEYDFIEHAALTEAFVREALRRSIAESRRRRDNHSGRR